MKIVERSISAQKPLSCSSSSPSNTQSYSYPFKYDDLNSDHDGSIEDEIEPQTPSSRIGSKIDEVFDGYFENSLFKFLFPNSLPFSPLTNNFSNLNQLSSNNIASFIILRSKISENWIQLSKALYRESLLDSGICGPVDLVVDESSSHILNRRSVYCAAGKFTEMSAVQSSASRSLWRFATHFIIYFVKGMFSGFGMYLK